MSTTERTIMASERWLVAVLLLGACASPSIRSDLRSVRELSHTARLAPVAGDEVDAESNDDAEALLAQPLDADRAVRIALLNNRELRARLRELGISRGRLIQAGLVANPTLEAELAPERDSHLELRVEYDVTSLLYAPLAKRAAAADLQAERFQVASAVVTLGYQVRSEFYALQAGQQRMLAALRTLDALVAGRDAAVALAEAGNTPQLAASTQIAAYERARISVAQLELSLASQRERMQRLLGLHGEATRWQVADGFAAIPEQLALDEDLERRALEASLDLNVLRNRLDASARRTGMARMAGWLPEVAVDVHALYLRSQDSADDRTLRWGGGLSVGVPLFDRQQGTRRVHEAEFDATMERYHGLAVDLRSAVRDARNHVVSSHARARAYQTVIVPAQKVVTEQTLLQYNAMQIGVFQLLDARRQQLEVELDFVETQREYFSARAGLEALLAGALVTQDERPSLRTPGAAGAPDSH